MTCISNNRICIFFVDSYVLRKLEEMRSCVFEVETANDWMGVVAPACIVSLGNYFSIPEECEINFVTRLFNHYQVHTLLTGELHIDTAQSVIDQNFESLSRIAA